MLVSSGASGELAAPGEFAEPVGAAASGTFAKPAELAALGQVVARALADYVVTYSSLTIKAMMRNVAQVPQALDASFPGYLAAGMIGILIKMKGVR